MSGTYKTHPIQLVDLSVIHLLADYVNEDDSDYVNWLKINDEVSVTKASDDGTHTCKLGVNHTEYDSDSNTISVGLQAETYEKVEDTSCLYHLIVRLVGSFNVDESNFPVTYVEDWAKRNAPLTIYPYIREHMYSLASRVGVNHQLILPLLEVPTISMKQNISEEAND